MAPEMYRRALSLVVWCLLLPPLVIADDFQPYRPGELLNPSSSGTRGWSRVVKQGFGDPNLEILGGMAEFQGWLYVAGDHKTEGCQIWRSRDGATWEAAVGPGARTPSGFGNPHNRSINELLAVEGWLYAGIWNQEDGAQLWRSADGITWQSVVGEGAATPNGFGKLENSGITALGAFQGKLFVGTGSLYCKDGTEVWTSSDAGVTWQPLMGERFVLRSSLARESKYLLDLCVFRDALYVSTGDQRTGGSEIWRTLDGKMWQAVVGIPSPYRPGMGNLNEDMIYDLEVFQETLYAGVMNYAREGGALWRSTDGTTWEVVVGDQPASVAPGFGDAANFGLTALKIFDGRLYTGTVNEQGAQLWRSRDGRQWQAIIGPGGALAGGFGTANNRAINGLAVFQGRLYVGTHNPTEGAGLWRFDPG